MSDVHESSLRNSRGQQFVKWMGEIEFVFEEESKSGSEYDREWLSREGSRDAGREEGNLSIGKLESFRYLLDVPFTPLPRMMTKPFNAQKRAQHSLC